MWNHRIIPIQFCLCVDDFGVKYYHKTDVEHLLQAIGKLYKYTADWEGKDYCGMHLDWDYDKQYVDVSMPGYVMKTIRRLQYIPKPPQYSPYKFNHFKYPTKGERQYVNQQDSSKLLDDKEKHGYSQLWVVSYIMLA